MVTILENEILNNLCDRILEALSQSGLDISDIDFQELVDRTVGASQRPKVNISINSGTFQRVTMNSVNKLIPIISLFIVIHDISGEKQRRQKENQLIIGIINVLNNQKFGLPLIDELKPIDFRNVTDQAYSASGYALYELRFNCSIQVDKKEMEEGGVNILYNQGELLKIVNNYYLNTPLNDGVSDMQSVVDFYIYNGGNAYTEYDFLPLFGGYAGSIYGNEIIYGGIANSNYN